MKWGALASNERSSSVIRNTISDFNPGISYDRGEWADEFVDVEGKFAERGSSIDCIKVFIAKEDSEDGKLNECQSIESISASPEERKEGVR